MIKIKIRKEYNDLGQISAEMRPKARAIVKKCTFEIGQRAIVSMGPPKHGYHYLRANGKIHIASAPGEPPAIDTGNLANSISYEFQDGGMTGIVFTGVEYAPELEFGGARILPRPFFTPASESVWPEFYEAMARITD